MKDTHLIRLQDKTDKERVKDRLIQTRKQNLEKEDRSRSKCENWLEDMFEHGGLWANRNEVDSALRELSKTKEITATKAQIHIRTKILHGKLEANIMLTKASLQELRTAVLTNISHAIPIRMQDLLMQWYNGAYESCHQGH